MAHTMMAAMGRRSSQALAAVEAAVVVTEAEAAVVALSNSDILWGVTASHTIKVIAHRIAKGSTVTPVAIM